VTKVLRLFCVNFADFFDFLFALLKISPHDTIKCLEKIKKIAFFYKLL